MRKRRSLRQTGRTTEMLEMARDYSGEYNPYPIAIIGANHIEALRLADMFVGLLDEDYERVKPNIVIYKGTEYRFLTRRDTDEKTVGKTWVDIFVDHYATECEWRDRIKRRWIDD